MSKEEYIGVRINRIAEILLIKGWKQEDLMKKWGKSQTHVSNICKNKAQPSGWELPKISEILDVPMNELIVAEKYTGKIKKK